MQKNRKNKKVALFGSLTTMTVSAMMVALSAVIGYICKTIPALNLGSGLRITFENLPIIVVGIMFGPIVGGIIGGLIVVMADPSKILWFIIFVVVLQQLDGNIIGPKILGDSTGLPAMWVMFAIIVFGGLFGFVGMFVGVPFFSVIYALTRKYAAKRLEEKKLPTTTTDYLTAAPVASDEQPENE